MHRTAVHLATAVSMAMLAACADSHTITAPNARALSSRSSGASSASTGGVYIETNAADANAIVAYRRASDGSLSLIGSYPTGGRGIGGTVDPLRSQYAVLLNDSHEFLFAVDAGSNEVTAFRVNADASLSLADRASSNGATPVSLAANGAFLYVLNAGDNSVSGFRVNPNGKLIAVPHSTRSLAAGAAGASTIRFTPDGNWIIVTERDANRIETFAVGANGRLGNPVVTQSSGAVPFGFDVTPDGKPVISEAGGAPPNGAVSSYEFHHDGSLSVVTGSLNSGGKAPCWLILTSDGTYGFVANSATDALASIQVAANGSITLLNGNAGVAPAGSTPLDIDLAGDRYLYALEAGSGNIGVFSVGAGATLTSQTAVHAGAPASGLQGIAAW